MMKKLLFFLSLFFILPASIVLSQTGPERRKPEKCLVQNCPVKDGVGLENIAVGQSSLGDVVARFGREYELIDHNQYSHEIRYDELGLSFYYLRGDAQKKIFDIEIRPPFKGVTESGIVLGQSTLFEVERKYWPSAVQMDSGSETWWLDYPGIQFHVAAGKWSSKGKPAGLDYRGRKVTQISVNVIDPAPPSALMRATPVEVSRGPLLFFHSYGDASGKRRFLHHVVDPETSRAPRLFLAGEDDYKPWHRFSRDEFLMGSVLVPSDLFYLNVRTGATLRLLEGGLDELYKIDGDRVFFIEQEHDDRGFAPNFEKVKAKRPQSTHTRYRLYVFDGRKHSPPTLVTREELLHVLAIDDEYCWVVVDRLRPELWRVRKDGGEERKIAVIDNGWVFNLKDAVASPDKSLLAFGVNDSGKLWMRSLVVIDVATGKTVFKSPEINVLESGQRTLAPGLKFVWLDQNRIRFSETERTKAGSFFRWVDLNIRTGKRLNQKRYSEIAYEHVTPAKDSLAYKARTNPWTQGLFVKEFPHLLYFKGETEPVGDLRADEYNTDIEISPEGRWAVFAGPKTGAYLADGAKKTKERLNPSGTGFAWMPSLMDAPRR